MSTCSTGRSVEADEEDAANRRSKGCGENGQVDKGVSSE